jgi:hypothetical protein
MQIHATQLRRGQKSSGGDVKYLRLKVAALEERIEQLEVVLTAPKKPTKPRKIVSHEAFDPIDG